MDRPVKSFGFSTEAFDVPGSDVQNFPTHDVCQDTMRLAMLPGVGPRTFQSLVAHFGSPGEVLRATYDRLLGADGVGPVLARAILEQAPQIDVDGELRTCKQLGIDVLLRSDSKYPPELLQIPDPPPLLYCQGELLPRDKMAIAIVGTRHATSYGKRQAGGWRRRWPARVARL